MTPSSKNDQILKLVEKRLKKYALKDVPAAQRTAINKTLAKVKTRVVRGVAKESKIRPSAIKKRAVISRATPKKSASIGFYRRSVSAIALGARQTRRGVRAGSRFYDRAFIQKVGSKGRQHVLRRKGRARYPLEAPKVIIREPVNTITPKVVRRVMKSDFQRLYQHELKRRAGR
jgi:hypothetical protein